MHKTLFRFVINIYKRCDCFEKNFKIDLNPLNFCILKSLCNRKVLIILNFTKIYDISRNF